MGCGGLMRKNKIKQNELRINFDKKKIMTIGVQLFGCYIIFNLLSSKLCILNFLNFVL